LVCSQCHSSSFIFRFYLLPNPTPRITATRQCYDDQLAACRYLGLFFFFPLLDAVMQPALTFVLILCIFTKTIHADLNITVDDTSSAIQYQGLWGIADFPGYDIDGSQHLIDLGDNLNPGAATATATFTFTGAFSCDCPQISTNTPSQVLQSTTGRPCGHTPSTPSSHLIQNHQ
jgi:hypothetical protein